MRSPFESLNDDVLLAEIITLLDDPHSLCALSCTSRRFKCLTASEDRWRQLFEERWGQATGLTRRALALSGGHKALYASKQVTEAADGSWERLCPFELQAALQMVSESSRGGELAVLFLLDGSGSVSEEDFTAMTDFVAACQAFISNAHPGCKVGVLQFSSEVRVEVKLAAGDSEALAASLKNVVRMNGGTNIALALTKAGQQLKQHAAADAARAVVLLTDGRVDTHQATEAVHVAQRLADEQADVSLFAFGVGQGVDKDELVRIVSCPGGEGAEEHYVALCVREGAPW